MKQEFFPRGGLIHIVDRVKEILISNSNDAYKIQLIGTLFGVAEEVKKGTGNHGYNAATGKYEDMIKAGVIDPAKVTRTALQNAVSIAGMFLTTEAVITEIPKKEDPMPSMGGGMPGMGGMGGMY